MKHKLKLAGVSLLASALLFGCAEEEATAPKKEAPVENTEAVKAKPEVKEEAAPVAEAGTVYGSLDTANLKKNSDSLYLDEERNVLYLMAGEEVFQVEVNLDAALGLNIEMDKQYLTDHAAGYMAEDASLTQTISDKEYVYESASLGKKYTVTFSGEEAVTRVIVSQYFE